MALYAIGDLHLSLGGSKPMDVFGENWAGHADKLRRGFSSVSHTDTVVLCGDLSWAMNLPEAKMDFEYISALPGKKLIVKGNHDYWWQTAKKLDTWFSENGWDNISLLHNNAFIYDDGDKGAALCGTRGWFFEEQASGQNEKIYKRELIRLEASLECGKKLNAGRIFVFLHYPPLYENGYECKEIIGLLTRYGVEKCFYGHLHGPSIRLAEQGTRYGIDFRLVSADGTDFLPVKIL